VRVRSSVALVSAAVVVAALLAAPAASAAPVSPTADPGFWQTDGRVDTVAYSPDGTVVYLGGIFDHLCPPTVTPCTATTSGALPISYLAALNVSTGAPITTFTPTPDGEVLSMLPSPDGSTLYVGGVFNHIGTVVRHKLAGISTSTGTAISTWNPNVSALVNALALSPDGSTLYLGGDFKKVSTVARTELAAVTAYSTSAPKSTLLPWNPAPSGTTTIDKGNLIPSTINSLVVRSDGQVYAGGVFTQIGGAAENNVAALGPATGGGLGTAVHGFGISPAVIYVVLNLDLTPGGTELFASGRGPGGFIRAYNSSSGAQLWAVKVDGDVQAAVATDTVVYFGGHFQNITIPGTSLQTRRYHMAAVDTATGATDPWNPTANSDFGVYGMAWTPGHVMAGGDFTQIDYQPQEGDAQFSGGSTTPPTPVSDLTASSTTKAAVNLSWSQSTDADSPTVTYRIYRGAPGGQLALLTEVTGPTPAGSSGTSTTMRSRSPTRSSSAPWATSPGR
jgi:large repetitive protein